MRVMFMTEICRDCGRVHEVDGCRTSAHAIYVVAEEEAARLRLEGGEPCEGCDRAVERLAGRVARWRNARARRVLRSWSRAAA